MSCLSDDRSSEASPTSTPFLIPLLSCFTFLSRYHYYLRTSDVRGEDEQLVGRSYCFQQEASASLHCERCQIAFNAGSASTASHCPRSYIAFNRGGTSASSHCERSHIASETASHHQRPIARGVKLLSYRICINSVALREESNNCVHTGSASTASHRTRSSIAFNRDTTPKASHRTRSIVGKTDWLVHGIHSFLFFSSSLRSSSLSISEHIVRVIRSHSQGGFTWGMEWIRTLSEKETL